MKSIPRFQRRLCVIGRLECKLEWALRAGIGGIGTNSTLTENATKRYKKRLGPWHKKEQSRTSLVLYHGPALDGTEHGPMLVITARTHSYLA
jgi:hypothetical protein